MKKNASKIKSSSTVFPVKNMFPHKLVERLADHIKLLESTYDKKLLADFVTAYKDIIKKHGLTEDLGYIHFYNLCLEYNKLTGIYIKDLFLYYVYKTEVEK